MVVDLVDDGVDDALGAPLALVVFDDWLALLGTGADDLESREALDAELGAQALVLIFVAVYGSDLGEAFEVLGGLLVGRLEVLAVTTPWGVELNDL